MKRKLPGDEVLIVADRSQDPLWCVHVGKERLDPRFDLRNHSPAGFNWGYGGSGPAQLALAILAYVLADDEAALQFYQDFKWRFVANLEADTWECSVGAVREWFHSVPEAVAFLERN